MTEPILPPSEAILELCDRADLLIEAYLDSLPKKGIPRRYESEVEYYTLMKLMIRHLESVLALARADLVLAPSAHLLARSLLETAIKACWMFVPLDPYEREVRWVLFFRSGIVESKKLSNNQHVPESISESYEKQRVLYQGFDDAICMELAKLRYEVPKQAPNFWEMLKELEAPQLYGYYVVLSAYTHSNFEAASLYHRNLGCGKELGEFTSSKNWRLSFVVAFNSFYLAAENFLYWIEADVGNFRKKACKERFNELVETLA